MQSANHLANTRVQVSDDKTIDVLVRVVLNSLPSPYSKRLYSMAIHDFLSYWKLSGKSNLDKLFLQTYITHMQDIGRGEAIINLRLSAIRKLAREAVELQIWPETVATAFTSVKNIPQRGKRTGNWLSLEQSQTGRFWLHCWDAEYEDWS